MRRLPRLQGWGDAPRVGESSSKYPPGKRPSSRPWTSTPPIARGRRRGVLWLAPHLREPLPTDFGPSPGPFQRLPGQDTLPPEPEQVGDGRDRLRLDQHPQLPIAGLMPPHTRQGEQLAADKPARRGRSHHHTVMPLHPPMPAQHLRPPLRVLPHAEGWADLAHLLAKHLHRFAGALARHRSTLPSEQTSPSAIPTSMGIGRGGCRCRFLPRRSGARSALRRGFFRETAGTAGRVRGDRGRGGDCGRRCDERGRRVTSKTAGRLTRGPSPSRRFTCVWLASAATLCGVLRTRSVEVPDTSRAP